MKKTDQKSIPAVSIKSLGGAAPEFDMPVQIARRDGTVVTLNWKLLGLRKSKWAELRDDYLNAVRVKDKTVSESSDGEQPAAEEFSFAKFVSSGTREAAELICKVAKGWDLEEAMTAENIVELEDILPSTISTTLSKIDAALFQGRLGN